MSIPVHIYKITNKINGKLYIGQTKNPSQRWSDHKSKVRAGAARTIIQKAMISYGIDNFSFEVIESCLNRDDANEAEIRWIAFYDSTNRDKGYNQESGGLAHDVSLDRRIKISSSLKGHSVSDETKAKISAANTGRVVTEETKRKQSESLKRAWSEGRQRKVSKGFTGKHTEESKAKMSESHKGKRHSPNTEFQRGSIPWNKKLTPEQEQEIVDKYSTGNYSMRALAKLFNIDRACIRRVVSK